MIMDEYENYRFLRRNIGDEKIVTSCYVKDDNGKWVELLTMDEGEEE